MWTVKPTLTTIIIITSVGLVLAQKLKGLYKVDSRIDFPKGPETGWATFNETKKTFPKALSFCMWVFMDWEEQRSIIQIESFKKKKQNLGVLRIRLGSQWAALDSGGVAWWFQDDADTRHWSVRKWVRVCMTFDFNKNLGQGARNGEVTKNLNSLTDVDFGLPKKYDDNVDRSAPGINFILGRYYDNNAMTGKTVDVNVWDRVLTEDEMKRFSSCLKHDSNARGNLVNPDSNWIYDKNLYEDFEIDFSKVSCTKDNMENLIMLPVHQLNYVMANKTCKRMGGTVGPEYLKHEDYHNHYWAIHNNEKYKNRCWHGGRILTWIPYRENEDESGLVHRETNNLLKFHYWINFYKPAGPKPPQNVTCRKQGWGYFGLEPFMESLTAHATWYTPECVPGLELSYNWAPCVGCVIPHSLQNSPAINLRGLCSISVFDSTYFPQQAKDGLVEYVGNTGTIIGYEEEHQIWSMKSFKQSNVSAFSRASFRSLLHGNHEWEIYNDYRCKPGTEVKVLSLTSCSDDEYTCNDGNCIDMDNRCNGKPDCGDRSDEMKCTIIAEDDSYAKNLSPPPDMEQKVMVNVSTLVTLIQKLDELESIFKLKTIVSLSWYDKRFTFNNLKNDTADNLLGSEEETKIWIPYLIFKNTDEEMSTILDDKTSIMIKKIGGSTLSSKTISENKKLYKGEENPLIMTRFYNIDFICDYQLAWYPFDSQTCTIDYSVFEEQNKFVQLISESMEYTGPMDLTQYFVKDTQQVLIEDENKVIVKIVLGRRLMRNILTVFLPSVIVNLIGHASNYFKPCFFDARIGLNVTVMLVIVTMFLAVMDSLPITAYIKMIDVWLIFNLFKPFVDLLLHTYADYLRDDGEDNDDEDDDDDDKTNCGIKLWNALFQRKDEKNKIKVKPCDKEEEADVPPPPIYLCDTSKSITSAGSQRRTHEERKTAPPAFIEEEGLPTYAELTNIDEGKQNKALTKYYSKLKGNEETIESLHFFGVWIYPAFCVIFIIVYWLLGVLHFYDAL